MIDPIFWLGFSLLLVAVSLTAVFIAALPVLQELARAAQSVGRLAETLNRELPPTLEAIRLTGLEISELTDDVNDGVRSAGQVVKQVDQSLGGVRKQAKNVQTGTRSVVAGVKAAWQTFNRPPANNRLERLSPAQKALMRPPEAPSAVDLPQSREEDYLNRSNYEELEPLDLDES